MKVTLHSDVRRHNIMQTIVLHEFRCVLEGNGEEGGPHDRHNRDGGVNVNTVGPLVI